MNQYKEITRCITEHKENISKRKNTFFPHNVFQETLKQGLFSIKKMKTEILVDSSFQSSTRCDLSFNKAEFF